jgi:hypothetical protein
MDSQEIKDLLDTTPTTEVIKIVRERVGEMFRKMNGILGAKIAEYYGEQNEVALDFNNIALDAVAGTIAIWDDTRTLTEIRESLDSLPYVE